MTDNRQHNMKYVLHVDKNGNGNNDGLMEEEFTERVNREERCCAWAGI